MNDIQYEVLIIGSGLAGMSLALRLAESGRTVGLIAKGPLSDSSSNWAQGGIAAAIGPDDTATAHAADTMAAGAGLCKMDTVEQTVASGPACIQWLIDQGVEFTQQRSGDNADLHLTREGGHSKRRVVHAADATGHAVMAAFE